MMTLHYMFLFLSLFIKYQDETEKHNYMVIYGSLVHRRFCVLTTLCNRNPFTFDLSYKYKNAFWDAVGVMTHV